MNLWNDEGLWNDERWTMSDELLNDERWRLNDELYNDERWAMSDERWRLNDELWNDERWTMKEEEKRFRMSEEKISDCGEWAEERGRGGDKEKVGSREEEISEFGLGMAEKELRISDLEYSIGSRERGELTDI